MARLTLGVIFGGGSEEHPISVKSAREVARHIDLDRYDPVYVGITPDGSWRLCESPGEGWDGSGSRIAVLSPDRGTHGLLILDGDRHETVRLDVVLPVLHGRFGEDGAIQGLLELAGIPYAGCDIQSSALCMDKSLAYIVAGRAGIETPRFWTLPAGETAVPGGLTYPVFVKPARSGSSFGVSQVRSADELAAAIAAARRYDAKVLIEQAVPGNEIGCALLGSGADVITGEIDQISLSHGFFRIHQEDQPEAGSDNATVTVPAPIPEEARARVKATAKAIYTALGCRGLARVDMFLTPDGRVVLNEVNTLPGLTTYSRYPRMMDASGLPRSEVIDRLISLALASAGER